MASTILIPNLKDEESPILLPKQLTIPCKFKTLSLIEYDSLTKIDSNTIYCILENKEIVKVYTGTNSWNLHETDIVDIPLIGDTGIFPKEYQEALNDDLLKVNGSIIIYKNISKENIDLYTINDKGFVIYTIYIEEETWNSKTVDQDDIKIFNLELNESSGEISEEILNTIKNSDLISINNHLVTYKFIDGIYTELHYYDYNFLYNCVINNDGNITYIIHKINLLNLLSIDLIKLLTGNSNVELMSLKAITRELDKKLNAFDIGRGLKLSEDGTLYCTLDNLIFQVVEELPADGSPNKIYLVNNHSSELKNVYSEYMWVNGLWELVGTHNSELNLDDYVTKSDLESFRSELFDEIYLDDILEFGLCNKETGEWFDSNKDTLYNDKSYHLKNWIDMYFLIHFNPKTVLVCGNIVASVIGAIKVRENLISVLCSEVSTEKLVEFVIEFDNTESEYATVYFTDFDYLTKKDLTTVNSQLQFLDTKINTIPVPKTYYEVSNVGDLEQVTEGNLVYVTKNIFDGETIYLWKIQDDETYLYTRTNTPGVKPAVYDFPESTEALANDYIISESGEYLIYTIDGTEYLNYGLYSELKIYLKGFYVKTSTDLLKLASQVDLPTKVSELDNDSKFATMDEVNMAILNAITNTLNTEV